MSTQKKGNQRAKRRLQLVSPTVQKPSTKRRRPEREAIPHTTGWVYDILGVDVSGPKKLYKVCVITQLLACNLLIFPVCNNTITCMQFVNFSCAHAG